MTMQTDRKKKLYDKINKIIFCPETIYTKKFFFKPKTYISVFYLLIPLKVTSKYLLKLQTENTYTKQ